MSWSNRMLELLMSLWMRGFCLECRKSRASATPHRMRILAAVDRGDRPKPSSHLAVNRRENCY